MQIEATKRLEELDSVRGLAALSVVFLHLRIDVLNAAGPDPSALHARVMEYLFKPVTAGREAVLLFFVLSGFVLSLPAIESHAQRYPVFLVRRIFRIYIPYLATVVLAVLGSLWLFGNIPIDWHLIGQHVIMLGQFDTDRYNMPIWSLVYEMRISLIFPLLCFLVLKMRPMRSLMAAVSLYTCAIAARKLIPALSTFDPVFETLHYAVLFVAGNYLARERGRIAEILSSLSKGAKVAIALLATFLYIYGRTLWLETAHRVTRHTLSSSADWVTAAGAAGLMVLSMNSAGLKRVLLWDPIHNLGKISYSLYLLHYPICLYLVNVLHGRLPTVAVCAICIGVVLFASWAFYRLVEAPSVRWGRTLSQRV